MIQASVHLFHRLDSDLVGECGASLGVDVQAAGATPGGECLRVDYGQNDDKALAFEVASASFRLLAPLAVGPGQHMRIVHDAKNARIVGFPIPDHADVTD